MMPVTPPSLLVTPTTFGWNKEDKIRKIQNILPLFDVYGRSEHFSHFHLLFESSVHLSVSPTHSLSFSLAPRGVSSTRGRVREREREAPSSESTCWAEERSGHASALLLCARTHTSERKRERFTLLWSGWVTVKNSLNSNWDKYEYKYSLLEIWWRLSDTYVCYIISIKLSNCCKMSSYSFSGDGARVKVWLGGWKLAFEAAALWPLSHSAPCLAWLKL